MYWREGKGALAGGWHGPARVVLCEGDNIMWLTHLSRLYRCAPEHVRSLSSRESENVQAFQSAELGPFPKPTGSASHLGTGVFQYHDLVPLTTMPLNPNAENPNENPEQHQPSQP